MAMMAGRDAHEQENTNNKHHCEISLLLFSTSCNPPKVEKFCAEAGKREAGDVAPVRSTSVLFRNALPCVAPPFPCSESFGRRRVCSSSGLFRVCLW